MARSHRKRAGRRGLARSLAVALPAVVALAGPGRAEAREGLDDDTLLAIVGGGAVAADVMFYAYDIAMMAANKHPSVGWSIAQTALTAPQTIAFGALAVGAELKSRHDAEEFVPAFLASMFTGAMTTHGIWSLASDNVTALQLFTLSPVIAGNTVVTAAALAKATAGELGSPALAITELTLAGPTGAYFIYRTASDEKNRSSWLGLSVWSGVIALHGAASLFAWRSDEIDDDDSSSARPKLPFTIQGFGPSAVSDGVLVVPGLRIAGRF